MSEIVRASNGQQVAVSRVGFGGSTELEMRRETAAIAVAERARAEVEAHYKMALSRPRSVSEARRRILDHCKRPRFAEAARYSVPRRKRVGDNWETVQIRGESIRFIETALQEYGNVIIRCPVTWEDENERRIEVAVIDLERNIKYDEEIVIRKVTEKRFLGRGEEALGQRETSQGNVVYLVAATDQRVHEMQQAAKSKAIRTLGKRILPADIIEEAMEQVVATLRSEAENDPAAARKRMADAFASIGVYPRQIEDYLGHSLEQITPSESEELRVLFATLRDGEATWADALEARRAERGEEAAPPADDAGADSAPEAKAPSKAAQALRKKMEQRRGSRGKAPAAQPKPAATTNRAEAPPPAKEPTPRGEASEPEPAAEAEATTPEDEDEFDAEVKRLHRALETALAEPDSLPAIRARIEALGPCRDQEVLLSLLQRAERAIEGKR